YLEDLEHATEVVLGPRLAPRASAAPRRPRPPVGHGGSAGRAAAGAVRIGHVIGAAVGGRRVIGPVEARLATGAGLALCALSILFAVVPQAAAWPLAALGAWTGIALLIRARRLRRELRS